MSSSHIEGPFLVEKNGMQTAPTVACVCTIGRESTRGQNVEAHFLRQKQIMHRSEREGGGGALAIWPWTWREQGEKHAKVVEVVGKKEKKKVGLRSAASFRSIYSPDSTVFKPKNEEGVLFDSFVTCFDPQLC